MNGDQIRLMEKYLNGIVARCERLSAILWRGLVSLLILIVVAGGVHIVIIVIGDKSDFLLAVCSYISLIISVTLAGLLVIWHIQKCMHQCDFIKLTISMSGNIDCVSDKIESTSCTKNLNIGEIKNALKPVNLSI